MDIVLAFFFFVLGIATDAVHNRIRRDSERGRIAPAIVKRRRKKASESLPERPPIPRAPHTRLRVGNQFRFRFPCPRLTLNPRKRATSFLRIFGTICRRTDALLSTFADKEEKSWKVTSASMATKRF